ncbi:hypothetical protein NDN08_007207 [Rhodosorus marinus]|uniref:C2H2-type domain-containing protein n=1 Tax=Rhodosorus marinus TaxID=101924 RepID=A0AAV8UL52_9RHOD|nr:hypothetical protein NDN08_007207 [Rhodosorus marinus]
MEKGELQLDFVLRHTVEDDGGICSMGVLSALSEGEKSWILFKDNKLLSTTSPARGRKVLSFSRLNGSPESGLLEKLLCSYLVMGSWGDEHEFGVGGALYEDGVAAMPMRYVVVRDASQVMSTIISIREVDGSFVVCSWTVVNESLVEIEIGRVDSEGESCAEQVKTVGERRTSGAEASGFPVCVLEERVVSNGVGSRFKESGRHREIGAFSPSVNGVWFLPDEPFNISDFLMKATFSSTTEVVEKVCSQFEQLRRSSSRQMDAPPPAEAELMEPTEREVSLPTITTSSAAVKPSDPNKPFKCESCHMSFKSNYEQIRHRRNVHEGSRAYPCRHCRRSFSQSGHRNGHERKEHLGQGEVCGLCGKKFGVKSKLERHVRTVHENIRNYECPRCGLRFKQANHLQKHQTTRHRP